MLKELIKSMRPHQWYKNLIIFIAIIFSFNLLSLKMWFLSLFAFAAFCIISGSVYIINDLKDVENDRLHPMKKFRPIAAGTLSMRTALLASLFLLSLSLLTSFFVSRPLGYIELLYIFINLLYTFYLKNYALIDVMVVAAGFVLRAVAGAVVINVPVSPWLILCVFVMAFVLAFGKRRSELLTATASRNSLSQYSEKMIEDLLNISVSMLLMSYALYSFFVHPTMMITLPFAFYGIFRFVQLIHLDSIGAEPGYIMKDKASLANLILWTASVIIVLYQVNM